MVVLITLIVICALCQGYCIAVHTHIMELYEQVCGHCDWWWDKGARHMHYCSFIPILGPFLCAAAHGDIVRNIVLELSRPDAK